MTLAVEHRYCGLAMGYKEEQDNICSAGAILVLAVKGLQPSDG